MDDLGDFLAPPPHPSLHPFHLAYYHAYVNFMNIQEDKTTVKTIGDEPLVRSPMRSVKENRSGIGMKRIHFFISTVVYENNRSLPSVNVTENRTLEFYETNLLFCIF
ncbi:hypothetical protein LOAG_02344 [Loa loa]|uniref:Uncharacterized protein n=1 Tax=Loa loa TaxID=7209 RepID=A0A1S0U783_LOALO|nr:hypothetical protein LOAG_02344 [Loa loa]EFO26140.1 hypothetical protein LOAG_02344 [Loa loa]